MRPILRAGLHAYPLSHSVIPGGSARSLPYPEVLSWRAILNPKKQLLKRLVVVRHRLRHNGKVLHWIKGTSIRRINCQKIDRVCHKLHDHSKIAAAELSEAMQTQSFQCSFLVPLLLLF
jgi:hypothetical protein